MYGSTSGTFIIIITISRMKGNTREREREEVVLQWGSTSGTGYNFFGLLNRGLWGTSAHAVQRRYYSCAVSQPSMLFICFYWKMSMTINKFNFDM